MTTSNHGDTTFCGKIYRKGHPLSLYSAALERALCYTYHIPAKWGDFLPRDIMQELMFSLIESIRGKNPKAYDMPVQELVSLMMSQVEHVAGGIQKPSNHLVPTSFNFEILSLVAALREAEARCVAARDQVELEARDTSPNLLYILEKSMAALNLSAKWCAAFAAVYSSSDNGKLIAGAVWQPWPDSKFVNIP